MDETSTEQSVGAAVPADAAAPRVGTTAPAEICRPEAPEPTVLPVDEWHGLGGDYVMDNGVRRPA